jgi:Protein of unknown function (DUF2867)
MFEVDLGQAVDFQGRLVALWWLSVRQTSGGYLAYLGVFVQPVHRFTRLYMAAIAPFRRLVVYPAIIRKVQRAWAERYGGESSVANRVTR